MYTYRFDFYPHTVILHYQSSLLFTREEVAIVLLGPFFNKFVFCLFILFSWGFQKVFGSLPDLSSQFIAAFGVQAILDPYWILFVDLALLRFNPPQPDLSTADITLYILKAVELWVYFWPSFSMSSPHLLPWPASICTFSECT